MSGYYVQSLENYWSPAQIRLFIGGVWIDDASNITYRITDHKVPKYGYFDRTYRKVAQGRTLVQGQIAIKFRYNGYLRDVIEDVVAIRNDFIALSSGAKFKLEFGETYEDMWNLSETDRLEWASSKAVNAPPEVRERVFNYMKDVLWKINADGVSGDKDVPVRNTDVPNSYEDAGSANPISREGARARRAFQRPGLLTDGFDIMMVAGTNPGEEVDPALTRYIRDIHLTGETFNAQIEVPDGGRALVEIYNFIARSVVSGEGKFDVPATGGARSA